jgi:endonuclease/exonuclease/phosphatase family metal-dependent hydrolase
MPPDFGPRRSGRLRIVSYNVHRCLGTDRVLSPQRIADVIAALEPDIVALQELDVGRLRSGNVDQAQLIAAALEMQVHFHPAMRVFEELYGDAVLTALPVRLVRAGALPYPRRGFFIEPRGALWVAVDWGGGELQLVNTHLGLGSRERALQVATLLGPDWLGHPDCRDPVILVGDLNAVPLSRTYRRLAAAMRSIKAPPAFPSRRPILALDHGFVRGPVEIVACRAVRTPATRLASDHLPLVIDVALSPELVQPSRVPSPSASIGRPV